MKPEYVRRLHGEGGLYGWWYSLSTQEKQIIFNRLGIVLPLSAAWQSTDFLISIFNAINPS